MEVPDTDDGGVCGTVNSVLPEGADDIEGVASDGETGVMVALLIGTNPVVFGNWCGLF